MTDTVNIPVESVAAAARALSLAGRWPLALDLLRASGSDDPRLLLAAAGVSVERDWFSGTSCAPDALANVHDDGWDVRFLRLRDAYGRQLRHPGTPADTSVLIHQDGCAQHDASVPMRQDGCIQDDASDLMHQDGYIKHDASAALRQRAQALLDTAPDETRRGWASMYLGLIADNIIGDRDAAPAHYTAALATSAADPLLRREALRHLGDHDHEAGDHELALERWRDATATGAAAGNVPGTLSQQLLLAVLARDTGDEAGAVALAAEVARWSAAIGAVRTEAMARAFLDGVDPTKG
ncbi:hypothetical protein KZZ52_28805 [Dactylosporangium sp. AC04546]|uniref:hypothetical protein n=1 Tax=Dactylosporangium sp. AC04546 TaxID=2862460 RepID=UPI001EDF0064|nr:hypothetical protein [Dactylosporangium sp. AC04546]WVK89271.1 hypothetical protein KZZ52_28805 [Dactylosporangium sp. AC04546]